MHRRAFWLVAGILGCGISVTLTLGGGLLLLLMITFSGGPPTVAETLQVAGIAAVGLGLGLPLALQGWAGWRGRESQPFRGRRVWWLGLLLALLIGLGAAVAWLSLAPVLLLPPVHVLTMCTLPALFLGLAGWALRGQGGSWREVIAAMAGGGLLGIGASLVIEALVGLAVVTLVLAATPDGMARLTEILNGIRSQGIPPSLELLNDPDLLLSPAVVIPTLLTLSVPVPLIEEAFKTLAVGIAGRWIRPRPTRAFLWGVASGAGFALVENLFSGAIGDVHAWPVGALARLATTVMHCFSAGLVGWGWAHLWTGRRPLRLLGAYACATCIHALWNGTAVGLTFLGLGVTAHATETAWLISGSMGLLVLFSLLVLMTLSLCTVLPIFARVLANREDHRDELGRQ